jgi:hypothetical protein
MMRQTQAKQRASAHVLGQPEHIGDALKLLAHARDILRSCGCKHAADYVAGAMKSTQGARNHAEHMRRRYREQWQI